MRRPATIFETLADLRTFIPRLPRIAIPALAPVDTRSLEVFLGVFMLAWGAWLSLPFQAYGSGFVVLAGYMPEGWCGALAMIFGACRMTSFVVGDYVRITSVANAMFWGGIAAGFAAATPHSPAVITYTLLTGGNLFVVGWSASLLHERRRA